MSTALLFMYAESPIHAGTGSTVSVIDLPIQRERTTQYPTVAGSGVKGALRSQFNGENDTTKVVFGPETADASAFAGAVALGEARVVLFPVRSLLGVFAHVTSPFVLARLSRDLAHAGKPSLPISVDAIRDNQCLTGTAAGNAGGVVANNQVVLEEFSFTTQPDQKVDMLAAWLAENALPPGAEYDFWRNSLHQRLVILPDDAFRDFVLNSTEVRTHIRIQKETKTVQAGALWTSESVPADTLMVSTVLANQSRSADYDVSDVEILETLMNGYPSGRVQLGGDETTGQGIVALNWHS